MLDSEEESVDDDEIYNNACETIVVNQPFSLVTPLGQELSLLAALLLLRLPALPRLILLVIFIIEEAIFHLTLELLLLLFLNLILKLLLSPIFFVEGFTQMGELNSDHEVQNEESSEHDTHDEEEI